MGHHNHRTDEQILKKILCLYRWNDKASVANVQENLGEGYTGSFQMFFYHFCQFKVISK